MKPTDEFLRQHDAEAPQVDARAFRQGWRVRTRLDQLLRDGLIWARHYQAATEFRAVYAIARELSSQEPGMIRIASSVAGEGVDARLDAMTRVRIVEDVLGRFATGLLVACVVEDFPWSRTAQHLHCDPKSVRSWTALAIRALAAAWAPASRPERVPTATRDPQTPGRSVRASRRQELLWGES